jgi:hypothetical protein
LAFVDYINFSFANFFYLFYLEHFLEQNEMTDAQTERKERKRGLTGHDSERNIKKKKKLLERKA